MRLLMIVYDAAFEQEVMAVLEKGGPVGYTKWSRVLGQGERSEPRLDQAVWPGYNQVVMTVLPQERAQALAGELADLRQEERAVGLSVYALPVEQLV